MKSRLPLIVAWVVLAIGVYNPSMLWRTLFAALLVVVTLALWKALR